jgi:hypothetical protein
VGVAQASQGLGIHADTTEQVIGFLKQAEAGMVVVSFPVGNIPAAEAEANYYRQTAALPMAA